MPTSISGFIYLFVGLAIVYLFQTRRRKLGELRHEHFPELDEEGYAELVILLKTAYERMLYMGVAFFPLAFSAYINGASISKAVFGILILLLFFSNIPPRNKIMQLLARYDISPAELKERGINL